ncbi:DUF5060 domain-containing protein [Tautonia plasticadhaerens]|uniref:DUF5060 domain-containing protein n=1 Tax=Tautonia plasticadhaerens TaxID=2527974 RepID=A0A518GYK2_9BACT|nr:DUF5060 domain-containing protein [Tautonia plasticadhaerens]QDV33679.1 hypothetical protein ElP_15550 [Tautonia plasticadhaerens]
MRRARRRAICFAFAALGGSNVGAGTAAQAESRTWHPVTIDVTGPEADEADEVNPFLDSRMDVTFVAEDGTRVVVPGFFAADGDAADSGATSGDVWRARFVPDRPGRWDYEVSLRSGDRIALSDDPEAGDPAEGDGTSGTLGVSADPDARGMLRHVGRRYLRFAGTGAWFLKGGADSPENFLAYADFDGTSSGRRRGGGPRPGEADAAGLHSYGPHVGDWAEGDPIWADGKGKGIIGALNYLASQGMNSVYFIVMNVEGDGEDVWPWVTRDARERFDVSKLDQWEVVFSHMDRLGIMLHVLLSETENENLFEHESGDTEFADARKLYYRELIARFGHHPALVWNLGEENGGHPETDPEPHGLSNTVEQRKAFADYLKAIDPYDHPVVVHTFPNQYEKIYRPLLGHPTIDGPSLQMGDMAKAHDETIRWIDASAAAGRPWFVCLDEIGPASTGVKPDADDPGHDDVRRHALWGNLMAGGAGVEWYFGYQFPDNDLDLEDFRSRANMWAQTRIALDFFHEHLRFSEMAHADEVVVSPEGGYGFSKPDEVYAAYLPTARGARLDLPGARFSVRWFDPRHGGELRSGSVDDVEGGDRTDVGEPPDDPGEDWVVLLRAVRD